MPGAGKQSLEIQEQIRELLEAGFDPTTIHRRLKVGRSSIYRMKRCLQAHGTAYMPPELNKKNGRPKVLTAEQELEVRDWLRKTENRGRYLDDLVWLIHDRFGIVCSTTTMSKMKRKWLRVIEYEETGRPLDKTTVNSLVETHPELPILRDEAALPAQGDLEQQDQLSSPPSAPMMQAPEAVMRHQSTHQQQFQMEPQIDSQLEQQIQNQIAAADPTLV
ncbi:hypothetical protein LTR37_019394 [Vermiconidia calcicola]|uniref:Uncharacterized protein n=1 Tax=Vermiconidia calcicola TaxID=1690605 RepID=A0ACC3ME49_9PEZI|nr:hypothetical protein LTR37_019394 [Vermiconidia calcicola]